MSEALQQLDPWDRQPREPPRAFQAFASYRDMDPNIRSIRRTAANIGKAEGTLSEWSSRYAWVERAAAYDTWRDREMRRTREIETEAMVKRHATLGQSLQLPAMIALRGDPNNGIPPSIVASDLSGGEVARLAEAGVRIERLAMGLGDGAGRGMAISAGEVRAIVQRGMDIAFDVIAACVESGDTDVERWQGEYFYRLEEFVNGREWRQT